MLTTATETDIDDWGSPRVAESRAIFALETTPENENLIRTHHPALRCHDEVYVSNPQWGLEV